MAFLRCECAYEPKKTTYTLLMISMDISSQQGWRVGSCCFAEVFRNWRRCKDRWTTKTTIAEPKAWNSLCEGLCLLLSELFERFSYDLERKTREQNRNNKRTEIERFDWFIGRTNACGFWLIKRTLGWKNFLEINRYFALTSHCNTIGQSNNAVSILGFSLAEKRRIHVLVFASTGW